MMPLYVNASTGNLVTAGYTLGFILPASAVGRCTISLMDQRRWGGCVDLTVMTVPPTSPPVVGGTMMPTAMPTAPPPPISITSLTSSPYRNTPTSCGDDFPTCCCLYANFTVRAAGSFGGSSWGDYLDVNMWTDQTCTWPGGFMMPATMESYSMVALYRESAGSFKSNNTVMFPKAGSAAAMMLGPEGGEPFRFRLANGTVEYSNEIENVFMAPQGPGIAFCSGYTSSFTSQVPTLLAAFEALVIEVQVNWDMVQMYNEGTGLARIQMVPALSASAMALQDKYTNFTTLYSALSPYERRFVAAANVTNTTMSYNMTLTQSLAAVSGNGGGAGAGGSAGGSSKEGETSGDTIGIAVGFFVLLAIVAALVVFRQRIADHLGSSDGVGAGAGNRPLKNIKVDNSNYEGSSSTDDDGAVVNSTYSPSKPSRPAAPASAGGSFGEWETLHDEDGTPYYHNPRTNETTWDMPVADM
jgi:hypothetical protein